MPTFIPCFFVGFLVLVVVLIVVGYRQTKQRREAMAAWAQRCGLSFSPDHDDHLKERFPDFKCLRQGDQDRYAYNICRGRWNGRDLTAFDYHYETRSTDSKGRTSTTSHHFSAVILCADIPLKPLVIRGETVFDKMAGFFGYDDIDFESTEFSRRFYVKSPDRRWAYDVIHARTMEFLLQSPRFNIQFDHVHIIAWRERTLRLPQFEQALTLIEGVLERFPDYLIQQQRDLQRGG